MSQVPSEVEAVRLCRVVCGGVDGGTCGLEECFRRGRVCVCGVVLVLVRVCVFACGM
jgi:hypothetical protein